MAETRDAEPAGATRVAPGVLIAGRYRLDAQLGAGGMGEVWLATHAITRRRVAMKFLKGAFAFGSDMRQRFFREARAASLVRHPNVVEVLDVFELDDGMPVMVMEHLVGETLGAKLARERMLPVAEVVALALPAIDAVATAHARGIVHRDLKPDNIFLEIHEGGHAIVKILDFGIAKLTAHDGDAAASGVLTESGSLLGTPWYMAPEQLCGESDIDARADIWGLGVILYECLSGRRPVEGSNMGQMVVRLLQDGITPLEAHQPQLPLQLTKLVGRMLARARDDRPRDLAEVRATLQAFAGLSSAPPTPMPSSKPPLSDEQLEVALGKTEAIATWDTGDPHALPPSASARQATLTRGAAIAAALFAAAALVWALGSRSSNPGDNVTAASSPPAGPASAPPPVAQARQATLGTPAEPPGTAPAAALLRASASPATPPTALLAERQLPRVRTPAASHATPAAPSANTVTPAPTAHTAPSARRPTQGGLAEAVPF